MSAPPLPPTNEGPGRRADRDDAVAVVRRLRDGGHVAYFAGGCVRDQLLGLEPKDYDVATDAPPSRVRELFANTQAVGAAFGVILVRHRRSQIEVATFRTDGKYLDGRRPEAVTFATAEEDARRRDFTINGMFFDPIDERVIDYVGGQEDLKHGIVRAIGSADERFEEDHLRMLRAIRFAVRFEMGIESATAHAIRRHGPQLKRISPERVADELRAMLPKWLGARAWDCMLRSFPGIGEVIFRFAGDPPPLTDRLRHASLYLLQPAPWPFPLCLAAMALDWSILQHKPDDVRVLLEKPRVQQMVRALRQSLRISNDEAEQMEQTLAGAGTLLREPHPPRLSVAKRFLARPTAAWSRQLLERLWERLGPDVGQQHVRRRELNDMLDGLSKTDVAPPPLVTGDDLTAAGLNPGPVFKRVLDAVYDAQLEDRVRTTEEALALALKLAAS